MKNILNEEIMRIREMIEKMSIDEGGKLGKEQDEWLKFVVRELGWSVKTTTDGLEVYPPEALKIYMDPKKRSFEHVHGSKQDSGIGQKYDFTAYVYGGRLNGITKHFVEKALREKWAEKKFIELARNIQARAEEKWRNMTPEERMVLNPYGGKIVPEPKKDTRKNKK